MNLKQLATDVTVFLTPFFPYLLLTGEEIAKGIGKRLGEAAFEKAKSLWNMIQSSTRADPKLNGVAIALAEDPGDEDFQVALAKLLAKHLEAAPELASELMKIMEDDKVIQTVIVERESIVKNISQRLSKSGTQEVRVRDGSKAGDIEQEM